MLRKLVSNSVSQNFAIVDSLFPQKEPFAFRNVEINEYLSRVKSSAAYTMPVFSPDKDAWFTHSYGVDHSQFKDNLKGYLNYYPENKKRIHHLSEGKRYFFSLAYSFFLAETYTLLPFYEKNDIPFVFVLYPGGCFGLSHTGSDLMLKKIFKSKCFKHVIVTQKIVYDYLIKNKMCDSTKVSLIYGGFVQFKKRDVKPKVIFRKDKDTFDICFVSAKYSKNGVDKGYDSFIETAKILCKNIKNVRFHVVGGFNKDDIDVSELRESIKFYDYRKPDFLAGLYSKMDIFLAQNRNAQLYEGSFDGFPLGIDASYCGVALFVADPLKMNDNYVENKELVIVNNNNQETADKIKWYYNNPEALYELSRKGTLKTQLLFDINHQIDQRLEVFRRFTTL